MAGSIVVDTNAGENALYEALLRRFDGSTVTRRKLDVGDVMLSAESGTVVVERKTWLDWAKSMTDGRYAACCLDRNGLRPARYVVTRDRHITLASEVGVWDYAPEDVVEKGRLRPGQMIAVDTSSGEILQPQDIDTRLAQRAPYKAQRR